MSIPATVGLDRMEREYARLLLLFWEEGFRPKKAGSTLTMANDVLDQWLMPQVKNLSILNHWGLKTSAYESLTDEYDSDIGQHGLCLGIDLDGGEVRIMENRLGKLEKATPGLGQAALYWVQMAGFRTIEVMTPEVAFAVAEYLWWNGETDDESWLSFCQEELDYCQEDIENLIGPNKFKASYPEWVVNPKKPVLSRLAPKSREGKKVLDILTRMAALEKKQAALPGWMPNGYDRIHWGAYMLWKAEGCNVIRVIDDHFERANMGGDYMTELNGYEPIPMEPAEFKKWKAKTERGFEMLGLLDQLIPLVSEER